MAALGWPSIKPAFSLQRRLLNDLISKNSLRRVSLVWCWVTGIHEVAPPGRAHCPAVGLVVLDELVLHVAFRFEKEAGRLVKAAPQALEQTLGAAQRIADLIRSLNPLGDLDLALAVVAPALPGASAGFSGKGWNSGPDLGQCVFSHQTSGRPERSQGGQAPPATRDCSKDGDRCRRRTPTIHSAPPIARRIRHRWVPTLPPISRKAHLPSIKARPRLCRTGARSQWARHRNVLPDRLQCRATRSRACSAAAAWAWCTRRDTWP